jgi:hypothetical protein
MIKLIAILGTYFLVCAASHPNATVVKKDQILGLWEGKFTVHDGSKGTFYFSIKPNNQLLIENYYKGVQRIANGTWRLLGNKFICTSTCFYGHFSNIGTITNYVAVYNGYSKLDKGIWQNQEPNNDQGSFTLKRIK